MNLAAIFAIICGAFVATVLILVVWLIINGLKDEAKRRNLPGDDGPNKP